METTENLNLKLTLPYDINEPELSISLKANKQKFIERVKIITNELK